MGDDRLRRPVTLVIVDWNRFVTVDGLEIQPKSH